MYISWDKYVSITIQLFFYDSLKALHTYVGLKIICHFKMKATLWFTCPEGDTG